VGHCAEPPVLSMAPQIFVAPLHPSPPRVHITSSEGRTESGCRPMTLKQQNDLDDLDATLPMLPSTGGGSAQAWVLHTGAPSSLALHPAA